MPKKSLKSIRRDGREKALQFLFQSDFNLTPDKIQSDLNTFWDLEDAPTEVRFFAEQLIHGVLGTRDEIDELIKKHSLNWDFHRIAKVDKNIMRLSIFEMLHRDDIPPVVSINEAVEIAKRYSTEESGKYVNGILDKIRSDLPRPARTPIKDTPA
ncbi:MAG: transcription antitermination factor NusB [Verrucomicrobiota bacterium]|nr:transcription antitermination factor NusB [Verrucomicrobiota bacterium]